MMNRILPILLILICIATFVWYIDPTYTGKVITSQQRIASYERALSAANTYLARENELIAERNQISTDNLNRLQEFLPDDVQNVQLILDLSALASRTGVTLSSFSINKSSQSQSGDAAAPATPSPDGLSAAASSPSNLIDSLDITVTATGSYNAFRTFLAASEQSLRPLDITSLTVSTGDKSTYTYNVTFRLYWLH